MKNRSIIELTRAQQDLKMLYEISNAMRSTLELEAILYIILTSVTAHSGLGFNRAILFQINKKRRCLEPKMAIGPDSLKHAQEIWKYIEDEHHLLDDLIEENILREKKRESKLFNVVKNLKIPLTTDKENILATVYHSGQAKHLTKSELFLYEADPLIKRFKTNELVIMPLKARNKVKGIIVADNLYTGDPITVEDLKMFTMLSNQAGLAIENSQLYEKIKHRSYTDSLTDVYNHGFFQDRLNFELKNSATKDQDLSLIMLDLDDFKKINDDFGHQIGDQALKAVAKILRDSLREVDYVCRYGGEEFVLILTDTSKDLAFTIAERIRKNIAKFKLKNISSKRKLTVSIGIACFPDDATSKSELIAIADKAMYVAKFSGKNRTCMHEQHH